MLKISSKSVPVVAAVALLAGVFSVASAHAATQSCQKTVPPRVGIIPSCTTAPISVAKNKNITVVASVVDGFSPAKGYVEVYKGTTLWKKAVPFVGSWKATTISDSSGDYRAKISALSAALREKTVKVSISTP